MIQARDAASLTFEPRPGVRVTCQLRREDFDGDRAIEPCVARTIHLTHASGAEQFNDLEGAQPTARRESRGRDRVAQPYCGQRSSVEEFIGVVVRPQ